MSKLREQIDDFSHQLEANITSSENRNAIEEYMFLIGELSSILECLQQNQNVRNCLTNLPADYATAPIRPEENDQFDKVMMSVNAFQKSWVEQDYRVRQQDVLENFSSAISAFFEQTSTNNQRIWGTWIVSLKEVYEVPEATLQAQLKAPHLESNAKLYQQYAQEFDQISANLPVSNETIGRLQACAEKLNTTRANMVFDFPPEIEQFFQYISSSQHGNSVPLSLLSSSVIDWLRDNGELENYVVKRKGARLW